jgi:hypothetical protein
LVAAVVAEVDADRAVEVGAVERAADPDVAGARASVAATIAAAFLPAVLAALLELRVAAARRPVPCAKIPSRLEVVRPYLHPDRDRLKSPAAVDREADAVR